MEDRDRLIALIKRDEGCRLDAYWDTANPPRLTIGYGRNLSDKGITLEEMRELGLPPIPKTITLEQAEALFKNDLAEAERKLNAALPFAFTLSPPRYAVLVSMVFQLGIFGFLKFRRALSALHLGKYTEAAKEMIASKWAIQTPRRARRLAIMMRRGEWL